MTVQTFATFISAPSNEVALRSACRVVDGGRDLPNPLVITGRAGCGKSHLLAAIGASCEAEDPTAKTLTLTGDQFALDHAASIREQRCVDLMMLLREADLLLIDDIREIAGAEAQQALLSSINAATARGAAVVVTADRHPIDFDRFNPFLVSVLCGGLVVDIAAAELGLRQQIINAAFAASGLHLDEDPVIFLARRLGPNLREVKGAVSRLVAYAQEQRREITVEFASNILASIIRANMRRVSIDEIQTKVAGYYRLPKAEMTSARRGREVARPRQVAMYLSKQLTPRSLPEIGRRFGGRDHTTVIHAVRQIEKLRLTDPELDRDVRAIGRDLQ